MVAHVRTIAFEGINVTDVDVQVQMSKGLPAFTIVVCLYPNIEIIRF